MGASAGGIAALKTILSKLPEEFPASVFITHTSPTAPGSLDQVLGSVCPVPVRMAKDREKIDGGRIYVAPPNLHLIIKRGFIRNAFLPKENGTRPAIDPMFRSAAHSYARRAIGCLLTGYLDDGAAGLGVIKDEGGITVVQDPHTAQHPEMPLSAIQSLKPDYIVPLDEIAPLLVTLINSKVSGKAPVTETETRQMEQVTTCPGCGGVLHQYTDDRVIWYQCRVGHRFTSESMIAEQNTVIEEHY